MAGKRLRKIILQLTIIFCILRKKKYVKLISQQLIRTVKKVVQLMIPNEEK